MGDRSPILLFDGTCGFCARNVQFVLKHEGRRRTMRFASLQSEVGTTVRRQHPELANVDSVIWLEPADGTRPESVFARSAAVLRVLQYLGGIWGVLGAAGRVVPSFIRDALYDLVARHRHKIVRGDPSCLLPTPEQRARFIDWGSVASGS